MDRTLHITAPCSASCFVWDCEWLSGPRYRYVRKSPDFGHLAPAMTHGARYEKLGKMKVEETSAGRHARESRSLQRDSRRECLARLSISGQLESHGMWLNAKHFQTTALW